MKPSLEYVLSRLVFDVDAGTAVWINATKHHKTLLGKEAGCPRNGRGNKWYWYIKIDGIPYKRSHLVFLVKHGRWPEPLIDHINGDSLDDRQINLREATPMQNAWNHKSRAKSSDLPMGVRLLVGSGRFQARIACNKEIHHLGTYSTPEQAHAIYQAKRKELFNEYA